MIHKVEGLFPEKLFEGDITVQDIFRQQAHRIVEDMDIEELEKLFTMKFLHPIFDDSVDTEEILHLRDIECFKVKTQINIK